jgi:hypothetical protein
MRRKCAWCGLAMGAKEPLDNEGTTHGICLSCGAQMLALIAEAGPAIRIVHSAAQIQLAPHGYGSHATNSCTKPRS